MNGAPAFGDVPLDLRGIADALDVHPTTPKKWRDRGVLPDPDGRLGRSDYWWRTRIVEWHDARKGATGSSRARTEAPTPHRDRS